ncbi:MAG: DUF1579 family protein [Planctomycetaceae bacterium]
MRRVFYSCVVAVAIISTSACLFAQTPQSPGKEHEELKALEGVWDAAMKMADGSEVKAESEFKMTCEGMWLASDFRGDFGGMKFHGKGLDGYDLTKKQYVSIWVDSMSGSPMVMTGKKEGKVTTMTGEGPGPAGDTKYKTISTQDSSDKCRFRCSRQMTAKKSKS